MMAMTRRSATDLRRRQPEILEEGVVGGDVVSIAIPVAEQLGNVIDRDPKSGRLLGGSQQLATVNHQGVSIYVLCCVKGVLPARGRRFG